MCVIIIYVPVNLDMQHAYSYTITVFIGSVAIAMLDQRSINFCHPYMLAWLRGVNYIMYKVFPD